MGLTLKIRGGKQTGGGNPIWKNMRIAELTLNLISNSSTLFSVSVPKRKLQLNIQCDGRFWCWFIELFSLLKMTENISWAKLQKTWMSKKPEDSKKWSKSLYCTNYYLQISLWKRGWWQFFARLSTQQRWWFGGGGILQNQSRKQSIKAFSLWDMEIVLLMMMVAYWNLICTFGTVSEK